MFLPIVIITFLSVVIPNIIFYACIEHLDAGVLSISVSVIPLFTYLIALGLRMDKFKVRRVLGLITGFCALLIFPRLIIEVDISKMKGVLFPVGVPKQIGLVPNKALLAP